MKLTILLFICSGLFNVILGDLCSICVCEEDVVSCSGMELENHFNATLCNGTKQSIADFSRNSIVHLKQFSEIGVNILILSHNTITKIDDACFKNLQNLTELDLSYNRLTSDQLNPHIFKGNYAPEKYEPLSNLRVLKLSSNALHTLHPDIFEHLPNIERLSLDSNPFKVLDRSTVTAIGSIPFLKFLDFSSMYLKSIPEHMFHTPRFLEVLNISSNLFTSVPIEIEETHNLKELILDDNPIASIKEFPKLDHLEVLHLSWMPNLISIESRSLSSLINLKELNCSHNLLLHSIDSTALTSANEEGEIWPPIIKLFLNNNKLGYLNSQLLMQWERVMYLNIQNNPWICDCNNQWLVSDLIPLLKNSSSKVMVDGIVCHEPTEMRGKSFIDLHHRNYFMRCLDKYGRQPEKDATVLVGVLIGVLLATPLTAIGFILYKRRNQTSTQYSRAFYKAADVNQVFTET